ncbi:SAV_2336 N-terminal domain-related protein [Streptomyces sp. NPDC007808]|uniref:SAV_2336 N-terminal domain-related protein n=1 Tax=Streptomyces sp. NPDC007808 TaxID=3364779 RepID=UPI0036C5164F
MPDPQLRAILAGLLNPTGDGPLPEEIVDVLWIAHVAGLYDDAPPEVPTTRLATLADRSTQETVLAPGQSTSTGDTEPPPPTGPSPIRPNADTGRGRGRRRRNAPQPEAHSNADAPARRDGSATAGRRTDPTPGTAGRPGRPAPPPPTRVQTRPAVIGDPPAAVTRRPPPDDPTGTTTQEPPRDPGSGREPLTTHTGAAAPPSHPPAADTGRAVPGPHPDAAPRHAGPKPSLPAEGSITPPGPSTGRGIAPYDPVPPESSGASPGASRSAPKQPPPPSHARASVHPIGHGTIGGVGRPADLVHVPRPAALSGKLALARALRPLRQTIDSAQLALLDEEATAQASSEAGFLLPLWRAAGRRRFSVDLLIDTGATMAVWHRLAGELWTALERHGAFAEVRCWSLATDHPAPRLAPFRRHPGRGAQPTPPTSGRWQRPLEHPVGRRLLFLLTDGVNPAWYGSDLPEGLAELAATRPTAALQVLPQHLWHRTALHTTRVDARIPDAVSETPHFRPDAVRMPADLAQPGPGARWLPVMELDGAWLAPWAELLAGRAPGGVRLLASPLTSRPRPLKPGPEAAQAPAVSAEERVTRFRAGCSAGAFRLACHLAAAPLSLPVMRLIQASTVPESGQTELAELFVSGLLERRRLAADPDEVVYDFRPGVRQLLLAELTRSQSLHVLHDLLAKVSGHVAATFGGTLDFRALTAPDSGDSTGSRWRLPAQSLPFAEVAVAVLGGAGVRHRGVAKELAQALPASSARPLLAELDRVTSAEAELPRPPVPDASVQVLAAFGGQAVRALAALDPPGLLAIGRDGGLVHLWDPMTGRLNDPLPVPGSREIVALAAFHAGADAYLAATDDESRRHVWRTDTRQGSVVLSSTGTSASPHIGIRVPASPHRLGRHSRARVLAAVPTPPTGILLITQDAVGVRVGGPAGLFDRTLVTRTETAQAAAVVLDRDGRSLLAVADEDGVLSLWSPATGRVGLPMPEHPGATLALCGYTALDGNIRLAAAGSGAVVWIWDPETGEPLRPLVGHTAPVRAIAPLTLPDGRVCLVTAGDDRTVRLWDPETGTPLGEPLLGHEAAILALAVLTAADGRPRLATGGRDGTVRIWDPSGHTRRLPDPLPSDQDILADGEFGRWVFHVLGLDDRLHVALLAELRRRGVAMPTAGDPAPAEPPVEGPGYRRALLGLLLRMCREPDVTQVSWLPYIFLRAQSEAVHRLALGTTAPHLLPAAAELTLRWNAYYRIRGMWAAACDIVDVARLHRDDHSLGAYRSELLVAAQRTSMLVGDFAVAHGLGSEAADAARLLGRTDLAAQSDLLMCELHLGRGDFTQAQAALQAATVPARERMGYAERLLARARIDLAAGRLDGVRAGLGRLAAHLGDPPSWESMQALDSETIGTVLAAAAGDLLRGSLELIRVELLPFRFQSPRSAVEAATAALARLGPTSPEAIAAGPAPAARLDLWLSASELLVEALFQSATGGPWPWMSYPSDDSAISRAVELLDRIARLRRGERQRFERPHLQIRMAHLESYAHLIAGRPVMALETLQQARNTVDGLYGQHAPVLPRLDLLAARAAQAAHRQDYARRLLATALERLDALYGNAPHQDRVIALRAHAVLNGVGRADTQAAHMAAELLRRSAKRG